MYARRTKCHCKESRCICQLPLSTMDHLELPCCTEAKYHVLCISKHRKCLKCKKEFNEQIKMFIKSAEALMIQKVEKEKKIESKRSKERKQLQKTINDVILPKYLRLIKKKK